LINLDTEEWGEFYISCAGGGDSVLTLAVNRENASADTTAIQVKVGGLKGGHSGVDIHLGRGSGTKIMGRILASAYVVTPFHLVQISGGNKRNSIADGSEAEILIASNNVESFKKSVNAISDIIKQELATTDPGYMCSIETMDQPTKNPISRKDTENVIHLVVALPHGVLAMSPEVEGLVETSTNIGVVGSDDNSVTVSLLTRSAVTSSLDTVKQQIRVIAHLVGAQVEEPQGYPGWKPNMDSEVLKVSKEVFKKLHGEYPEIKAIHAGLECGLFGEKLPGVDMLSIGPDMRNVHSPAEELDIPSIPKTYDLLKEILKALA
jgi:dipeptidase D